VSAVASNADLVWQTTCASVRGASHKRGGSVNQDSGKAAALAQGGAIIAVADGHGDELHARSDRGSRFAIEAAHAALAGWIGSGKGSEKSLRDSANALPGVILRAWRDKVASDLARDPPSEAETTFERADKTALVRRSPEILYGSTLVAAAIDRRAAAYVQIGDGDLLVVGTQDKVGRLVPARRDLVGNQTESLCQADAEARFRVQVDFFARTPPPQLVLAATDGYCNSYAGDDPAFLKVASDIKAYLDSHGMAWIEQHVENWLEQTSQTGSGDDITVAVAWLGPAVPPPAPLPPPRRQKRRRAATLALVVIVAAGAVWFSRDRLPTAWKARVETVAQKTKEAFGFGPKSAPPAPPPAPSRARSEPTLPPTRTEQAPPNRPPPTRGGPASPVPSEPAPTKAEQVPQKTPEPTEQPPKGGPASPATSESAPAKVEQVQQDKPEPAPQPAQGERAAPATPEPAPPTPEPAKPDQQ